jgi:protocatechuate 3,4-dioxygenase beta subunit
MNCHRRLAVVPTAAFLLILAGFGPFAGCLPGAGADPDPADAEPEPVALTVTVLSPDGAPVADAIVAVAAPLERFPQDMSRRGPGEPARGTTDDDGRVTLSVEPVDRLMQLHAQADGFLMVNEPLAAPTNGATAIARTVRLKSPTIIHGRILGPDGEPQPGVEISGQHLWLWLAPLERHYPDGTTDETGRFRIALPDLGGYRFTGPDRRDAAGAAISRTVDIWSRGGEEIATDLTPTTHPTRVALTLTRGGKPVARRAHLERRDPLTGISERIALTTDESGRGEFMATPGQEWVLIEPGEHRTFAAQQLRIPQPAADSPAGPVAVAADLPVGTIPLTLTQDGEPVGRGGHLVVVRPLIPAARIPDWVERWQLAYGVTAARYDAGAAPLLLTGLAPGAYDVWAVPRFSGGSRPKLSRVGGIAHTRITVQAGSSPDEPVVVTLPIPEPGGLTIEAAGYHGGKVMFSSQMMLRTADGLMVPLSSNENLSFPLLGRVHLGHLPAGRFRLVQMQPHTGLAGAAAEVEVTAGEFSSLTLTAVRDRRVRLTVVDGAGEPVPAARWRVRDAAGIDVAPYGDTFSAPLGIGPSRPTGIDGRVTIIGLRPGRHTIEVETPTGARASTTITIAADADRTEPTPVTIRVADPE